MKPKYIILLTVFSFLTGPVLNAQSTPERPRWQFAIGANVSLTRNGGEAARYLHELAGHTSTNAGIRSRFETPAGAGWGADLRAEFHPTRTTSIGTGLALGSVTIRQRFRNEYDPALAGVLYAERTITDQLLTAGPHLYLGTRFGWLSINAGIGMQVFITDRTTREIHTRHTNGSHTTETHTTRGVTWDQPIYPDAEAVGGVRDFTHTTGYSYGFNPLLFDAFAELRLSPFRTGPFFSLSWHLPLNDYRRSGTPAWTLITAYDPGTLNEINLPSRMQRIEIGLGWLFKTNQTAN